MGVSRCEFNLTDVRWGEPRDTLVRWMMAKFNRKAEPRGDSLWTRRWTDRGKNGPGRGRDSETGKGQTAVDVSFRGLTF